MIVRSALKDYTVSIVSDLCFLDELVDLPNVFYVVDANVWHLYKSFLSGIPENSVFVLNASEESKVIATALEICERMISMDAKRNAHIVSIGGGITQDLTGFVANILYRGIRWTFVPTTLLAACDSCIGGKTSLNYKTCKNLLGTFYPPDRVIICPEFFKTLSKADLESGLGEVVKFNVMAGEDALSRLEDSIELLLELDMGIVSHFVENSLEFKRAIIEEDEFDCGRRVLLNYAHTFGHAFEVSSAYAIPHGTAVALGMVAANRISINRGILNIETAERIERLVLMILPNTNPNFIDFEKAMHAIRRDKKQIGASLTAVLLDSKFELDVVRDITEDEVKKACEYVRAVLKGFRR